MSAHGSGTDSVAAAVRDSAMQAAPGMPPHTATGGGEVRVRVRQWQPPLDPLWWLRRRASVAYMLREASCVAVGAFAAVLVAGLWRLGQGPEAWEAFRATMATRPAVALQSLALAFALWHSITWFALAPRTMPLQLRGRPVPGIWIAAAHYLLWFIVSIVVLLAVGGLT